MTRLAPLALLLLAGVAAAGDHYEALQEAREDKELLRRSKRRFSFGEDESYEYEEVLDFCYWCGTNTLNTDSEHRTATITSINTYLEPGTCEVNQSPNYPGKYPHDIDYRWTYTTHPDSVITFTVPSGGLQKSRGCHRDKLAVVVNNRSVRKCSEFSNFVQTSGNTATMYIRFETNHRIHWRGYNGTVCASELPTTTTTSTTSTTTPSPILCDDVCGNIGGFPGRISLGVSGTRYPWVVTVDIFRDEVYVRCSGYLISRTHVVTAAFCFYQQSPTGTAGVTVRVTAGEYDLSQPESPSAQVLYTSTVDIYPDFDHVNLGGALFNMAVLTMPGDGFTFNTVVAPICLPDLTIHSQLVGVLTPLSFSGFGWTKDDEPLMNMSSVAFTTCEIPPFLLGADIICLIVGSVESPCHGDPGGAIHAVASDGKYYAVGTVNSLPQDSCPLTGLSLFMTQATSFYTSWINGITGERHCNQ